MLQSAASPDTRLQSAEALELLTGNVEPGLVLLIVLRFRCNSHAEEGILGPTAYCEGRVGVGRLEVEGEEGRAGAEPDCP